MDDNKFKILIVDDEEDNLALLYRTLKNKYDVHRTTSPLEALEMLKNESYKLIISDHKMPEMDGVEFLRICYENYPDIVRLLLTAYSDASILIDSINYAKIYRYIKKPFVPDELIMIVEASLEFIQLKKENELLIADLKDLFSGTVKAIVEALDAKDKNTVGRSQRVTYYAVRIAEKIGLPQYEVGRIELAGMLHDIGMIGIRDDIIAKAENLTNEEFKEIRQHVNYGIKILEDIKQLKGTIKLIKHHHEFWNGEGYPDGLKGEEIPLGSRIIAIADAYEGMVSKRTYRKAYTHEEAVKAIKELSGIQFDPALVEIFDEVCLNALNSIKEWENKS